MFSMLIWFLPTFFWSGEKIDVDDRPFSFLKGFNLPFFRPNNFEKEFKGREGDEEDLKLEERLSSIVSAITVESSFSKVYNRLFCPQCVARFAAINAVGVRKFINY